MRRNALDRRLPRFAFGILVALILVGSEVTCAQENELAGTADPESKKVSLRPPLRAAQPTALLVAATNAPLRVLGSDGMEHLEYDLIITNVFTAPVTLVSVDVVAADGRQLLRLDGDALAAVMQQLAHVSAPPIAVVPVSGVVAVVMDVVVPPGQVPERLSHRIAYELPADAPAITLIDNRVIMGPVLQVDRRAPLVIAPPLRGPGWLNFNGCCVATTPHRSARLAVDGARLNKFETFAIDWVRLQGGQLFTGNGTQNEQWFCFGADIVSIADGTVVAVRNDMPNEIPLQPPVAVHHPDDYAGNRVVVKIQPGVWALYAHLQPGSVTVRVGDRVRAGQLLGRLGNSGNSSGPHLHFQLADGADVITSHSLPFVLDHYTLVGAVVSDPNEPPLIIGGAGNAQRESHPLVYTVQDFR